MVAAYTAITHEQQHERSASCLRHRPQKREGRNHAGRVAPTPGKARGLRAWNCAGLSENHHSRHAADILGRTCGPVGDAPRILHAGLGINDLFPAHVMLPPVAKIVVEEKARAFLPVEVTEAPMDFPCSISATRLTSRRPAQIIRRHTCIFENGLERRTNRPRPALCANLWFCSPAGLIVTTATMTCSASPGRSYVYANRRSLVLTLLKRQTLTSKGGSLGIGGAFQRGPVRLPSYRHTPVLIRDSRSTIRLRWLRMMASTVANGISERVSASTFFPLMASASCVASTVKVPLSPTCRSENQALPLGEYSHIRHWYAKFPPASRSVAPR